MIRPVNQLHVCTYITTVWSYFTIFFFASVRYDLSELNQKYLCKWQNKLKSTRTQIYCMKYNVKGLSCFNKGIRVYQLIVEIKL